MKNFAKVAGLVPVAALAFASCSKLGPLTADNFTVTPVPLEVNAGKVAYTVQGRFPEKYMKRKAAVVVTPELRYAAGVATDNAARAAFQGEKVQGNDQEISYRLGGNYTLRGAFDYTPDMQVSDLYLKFDARIGKKQVNVPDVRIGYGIVATSTLAARCAASADYALSEDAFQYTTEMSRTGQIKFLINQAKVRTSELNSVSVQEFVQTLRDIKADQKGFEIAGVEISAYASPEGSLAFNTRLAGQREKATADYVKSQLAKLALESEFESGYTAEDWEGFQELVRASNMQDKDVILRVLSMYEDPEEREKQIRNLSAAFSELADEILPELRRARLTVNYLMIGRTDDEIAEQYAADPAQLSIEELLYFATLADESDIKTQQDIYATAARLYPADYRAFNNLARLAEAEGNMTEAGNFLAQARRLSSRAPEVGSNAALLALASGDVAEAEAALATAGAAKNYAEALGNLQLQQGQYAAAAASLRGVNSNAAALAQLLSKDYATAASTLGAVKNGGALTKYLSAVLAARLGDKALAASLAKEAVALDPTLADYAAKDIELK